MIGTRPFHDEPFRMKTASPLAAAVIVALLAPATTAQDAADRAAERLRVLRQEAEALAAQQKSLLTELRKLEVERDIRIQEQRQAEARLARLSRELADTTSHIETLERARSAQAPQLAARLRELYKLGDGAYIRLLFSVDDPREVGRAYRAVAALADRDRDRVRAHESTLASLRQAREQLSRQRAEAEKLQGEAAAAARAATAAVNARAALVARIDRERDLNAQLVGELQAAREKLNATVSALAPDRTGALPLRPFRGALEWPAPGSVIARFGVVTAAGPRNGIELTVPADSPVRAVHEGVVAHAGPFAGFGNLVILDHGGRAFSLYGYLAAPSVSKGDRVAAGGVVGEAGTAPDGKAARLYFELRIDGRAVDPLQWLKPRF